MASTNGHGAGNVFPIDSKPIDQDERDCVVVVGSGAGGGTIANQLCQQGIRTVVLEAGPHLTGRDYVNDEWEAFNQMAWLDPRTTSGSFRITKDFPNLPAWTVKAVEPEEKAEQFARVPRVLDHQHDRTASRR